MPNVDPRLIFWLSIIVAVTTAVATGQLGLKNAIPAAAIDMVTAWSGIIAFVGGCVLSALAGKAMTTSNRISSAAAVPGVKGIVVDRELVPTAIEAAAGQARISAS